MEKNYKINYIKFVKMNNHEFTKIWRNKNSTKCWSKYKFGLEIEILWFQI